MSDSASKFPLLHEKVQKWVWEQKWPSLREIQELSIEPILSGECDVILSASTASGKTEAAFLPAMSKLVEESPVGVGILCLSPLKALINDQFRRLESLGDFTGEPVTPWHGDISESLKKSFLKNPQGALLITPESLESLLLNKGKWCQENLKNLQYFIIDEFHAFVGSERGRQLQSLLVRLDFLINRITPRIALSATLGDMERIAYALRPHGGFPQKILESHSKTELKLEMRGYLKSLAKGAPSETLRITDDLFKILRGKNNLVFANSRNNTESYAYNLSEKCREEKVPNEFFPHHGSLSREIREDLEKRLQENKVPTTAVCTMTLELGIDIGHVDSIAQLAPPQSIASLRQRLGRSGRRGKAAVLRFFITELKLDSQKHITDMLRLNIFQIVSMVNLLLEKWYEPPNTNQYHFSTLIQQTLSVIGQYGGVMANQLWELLCGSGPFEKVSVREYEDILRALGKHNLITQSQDGTLIIGDKGEQLVSNYTFYSAFNTPEEYTLETSGKTLGTLPIVSPLSIGEHLVFAGKRWEIIKVFQESKHIVLKASTSGEAPNFSGNNQMLHDRIREEMLKAYLDGNMPVYLNNAAQNLFNEGLQTFNDLKLKDSSMIEYRDTLYLFPWKGDRTTHAISCILRLRKIDAETHNGVIEIKSCDRASFLKLLRKILRQDRPGPAELVSVVLDTVIEKYDRYVPYELNALDYASKMFDIDKAWQWLNDLVRDN